MNIGTKIYTWIYGTLVGDDEFGNRYYCNSKNFEDYTSKRWVIFNGEIEASKIPPEWHRWIHFITNNKPSDNINKFKWQKKHEENLTGSIKAYKPEGSLANKSKKNMKKYETWKY